MRKLSVLAFVLMFLLVGCKENETVDASGESVSEETKVQFSYKARYSQETKEFYVVAGEHARIPIGYDVIISVPGDVYKKFKVVVKPTAGAEPLEGIYETGENTYNPDYKNHVIMTDDLRHVYSTYAPELEATCLVYDITEGENLIFEGKATIPALEARELELIALEEKATTVSAEVTHYNDMVYEWRMNNRGDLQLAPQSGDMGWSSEGFIRDEDTEIAVTIYDELGRFNNFLFIYPKD